MIYLLDTNTVSHALRQQPQVLARLQATPMSALHLSAVTHAELMYGLAKRPQTTALRRAVAEFLLRVTVMPFDTHASTCYGDLRAEIEQQGKSLAALDMMIAAHARALNAILVSNDGAFAQIAGLALEDWSR